MKTFKSKCGCEIHVIKWSSKANSVTVQSCPVHKNAVALLAAVKPIIYGFTPDPGTSDLDNEQPIHVSMTLGDYRNLRSAVWHSENGDL